MIKHCRMGGYLRVSWIVLFYGLLYFVNGKISLHSTFGQINVTASIIVNHEWNCSLSPDLLKQNLTQDSHLYKNATLFFSRRLAAKRYLMISDWSTIIARAWWEIATGKEGRTVQELREKGFYNPLLDFVEHIHYFQMVREIMFERGEEVFILGKQHSSIHDVDKLHPVMLAAYAEKFEDQKDTSLWNTCVDHHISINPHHQGNCLWQNGKCSKDRFLGSNCINDENICYYALLEMICDKVSRKVQKELDGKISEDMWDVDRKFFLGLPEQWLDEAYKILKKLKRS